MRSPRAAAEEARDRAASPLQTQTTPQKAGRRKGAAATAREWLVISALGQSSLEEAGKHSIMRRTGLPARDLRALDPLLSYPSTILGRERAIVINLEHIKAIITAAEVLIPNSKEPLVVPFVRDLQARVSISSSPPPRQEMGSGDVDGECMDKSRTNSPPPPVLLASTRAGTVSPEEPVAELQTPIPGDAVEEGNRKATADLEKDVGVKVLPFEFRVLEVCLESACRYLESDTYALEKEAYPALDELTSKISTLNLEHVRQIKSRLVAISGRVQKVKDELEHLLDDDMDMAALYLTEKLAYQLASGSSLRFHLTNDGIDENEERDDEPMDETERSYSNTYGFRPNIDELEMLLEAYFVQIDGTLNKLSTLREYVDDTEDYINIMLDDKQNQLLQMGVMISTATLIITAAVVIVGLFGMNIHINIFDAPYYKFWQTTFGLVASVIFAYIIAIAWGKKSGLLQ